MLLSGYILLALCWCVAAGHLSTQIALGCHTENHKMAWVGRDLWRTLLCRAPFQQLSPQFVLMHPAIFPPQVQDPHTCPVIGMLHYGRTAALMSEG